MRLGKRSEKPPAEERRAEPSAADVYSGKYSGGGASAAAGAPPSQAATGLAKGPAARKGLTRSLSFGSKPMRAPPVAENSPAAQNRSP